MKPYYKELNYRVKVLAIDTATPFGVIGLLDGDREVRELGMGIRPGGERLPAFIDEMLKSVGWVPQALDLIVAGNGPGSYTGIRVGLALARSMAFALTIPLVGISTQEAIGASAGLTSGNAAVLNDARRGEVYTTVLRCGPESRVLLGPEVLGLDELAGYLNNIGEPVYMLGDGARVYRGQLEEKLKIQPVWAPQENEIPSGFALARLGLQRWQNRNIDEIETCVPLYLRRVEAEIRLEEQGRTPS